MVNYGKIIEKNEINLSNISIYPSSFSKDGCLNYNQHYLQLKYNYENTSNCLNGCYLLITYERALFKEKFPIVGFEFTILSRTWKYTDYLTQIIDIPYNEFIIGCFNQEGIQNHHYSIYIPNDAEKIIIEVGNKFLNIFYDKGRKKVNTIEPMKSTKKLNLTKDEDVFVLNIKNLNLTEKELSFTFKPIYYFSDIISFYYFRILYVKENEEIYYPLDSYLGNLCIPELIKDNEMYHCNFLLKNNYGESDLKFILSSNNQNDYYKINSSITLNNNTISNETEFVYVYDETIKDINYYIFKFEFKSNITKNILISFYDTIENVYLQIYSSQIYFIDNEIAKINHFKINNKYSLLYQYIYGSYGQAFFPNMNEKLYGSRNLIGRPLGILMNENITYSINRARKEFGYCYKLIYNSKNLDLIELNLGEPRSQIINGGQFPLYFYLKLKENKNVNIIVNIRLKAYDDSELEENIEIYGYLLSENNITRIINEEYYDLKDPIKGYFSNAYNIGFLQVNQLKEGYKYLLIEIQKKVNPRINSYILADIVTKEYDNRTSWLPINRYIFETFNDTNNEIRELNRYHININRIQGNQVLIELSSSYDEINIEFENDLKFTLNKVSGFKKYRITDTDNFNIFFIVKNPKKRITNYMIRYFYTEIEKEYEYNFDGTFLRNEFDSNDDNISISLIFNGIKISTGATKNETLKRDGIYFLITGTLYKQDKSLDESINSTCKITKHIPFFTNLTTYHYNYNKLDKFTLVFKNIPRKNNYIYELQLQINAIISKSVYNEEMLIYTTEVDLTNIELKKKSKAWIYILIGIASGIVLILVIFFIIRYVRLHNRNKNLQNEIKSIAFSNDIQKNVLVKDRIISKNESDFENTFS